MTEAGPRPLAAHAPATRRHEALSRRRGRGGDAPIMAGRRSPGQDRRVPDGACGRKGETVDELEGLAARRSASRHPVVAADTGRRHMWHRRRPQRDVQHLDGRGDRGRRRGGARRQARQPRRLVALRFGRPARGARRQDRPRRGRRASDAWPRPGSRSCSRPCSIPRWATPGRFAASSACRPCSTSSARSRTLRGRSPRWSACSDERMLPLMAEVLARRGARARGSSAAMDGLDELTTTGPSTVFDVARRRRARGPSRSRRPRLARADVDDLRGGDATETSAASLGRCCAGEPGPRRDVVLLNAGAALGGGSGTRANLEAGDSAAAGDAIDSGGRADARAMGRRLPDGSTG